MEAFYASVSGVITAFGSLIFFFILLRKDILRVEDRVIRVEDRVIRVEDRVIRVEDRVIRVEDRVIRVEDRVIRMDDRLRDVEGDMKVVKYQLQINEGPPADSEPTRTPARNEPGQRGAPVPSKK